MRTRHLNLVVVDILGIVVDDDFVVVFLLLLLLLSTKIFCFSFLFFSAKKDRKKLR